jgi:CBS domain-containing protein
MKISEIMTTEVMTCKPTDTLAEAAAMMRDLNVGICPIVQDDKLVGVITDRDITVRAIAQGFDPNTAQVKDFMTPSPITVEPDTNVEDAAEMMMMHQIRRLPVVDERGKLVGIVSLGDLAVDVGEPEMIAETLEEISEPVRSERH